MREGSDQNVTALPSGWGANIRTSGSMGAKPCFASFTQAVADTRRALLDAAAAAA